ncbi:MAG: kelch repeat-containing protein, partial [Blastocatellia bacterium]
LVAGGLRFAGTLNSAELYDPATGQWTATGNINEFREYHTATLLPNGKVLVVGGWSGNSVLSSAELYDPNSGSWNRVGAGQLSTPRERHTTTLLPNGKVLVTGGADNNDVVDSAELHDPATGSWMQVNRMSTRRFQHTAMLLTSGKVLVAGGVAGDPGNDGAYLDTAELFDPATNTWSQTGRLSDPRNNFSAVLLPSGQVLAVGGIAGFDNNANNFLDTAERYDPGLGFGEESRPVVGRVTLAGGVFTLTGVRFQSASEGSSGGSQNSAGNFPIVQLRDAESGQTRVLTPGPSGWSNNSFTAQALSNPPTGYSLLTVISNGVPGPARAFSPGATGAIPTYSISGRVSTANGVGFRARMTLTPSVGEQTGAQTVTQTNANGEYSFPSLPTVTTPTPITFGLQSMTPHAVRANSGAFQIQVFGSGFTTNSRVQFQGVTLNTSFINSTQLAAVVPALSIAGFYDVTVTNGGGAISNALRFSVTPAPSSSSDLFRITRLSPSSTPVGTAGLTIIIDVEGANLAGAFARWNGASRQTSVINSSQLRVTLTSVDLAQAVPGRITVVAQASEIPIESNPLWFTVTPPGAIIVPPQQTITYTVTPSANGPDGRPATFDPTSRTFSGLTGDVTNANFGIVGRDEPVIGTITIRSSNNSPLAQVLVTVFSEDPVTKDYQYRAAMETDANGGFSFSLATGRGYLIRPQLTGYKFNFPDRSDQDVYDIPTLTGNHPVVKCEGQLAAHAPVVMTNSATDITTTTATLKGTVNPNGAATDVSFEYATNAAFNGSTTVAAQPLPGGNTVQPVSVPVTNLTPGATYFFRVRASNSAGPATGESLSFTTLNCNYSINPTSQNFPPNGGTGSVAVTTAGGCAWTATSNAPWITINSGAPGSGDGAVNYSVTANAGPRRTGTMVIAGQTFTVMQEGVSSAVTVRIGSASGMPGGAVSVPIELVSTGGVNALGFSLNFDPAVLTNSQAAVGGDAAGATLNPNPSQVAQGRLGLLLALPSDMSFAAGTRQIMTVTFTIADGGAVNSSPITFGSQPTPQEVVDVAANVLPANFQPGAVIINQAGFEADVNPRPNGNGVLSVSDWVLVGRFVAGVDTPAAGGEYQRADCAPRATAGDGRLTVGDWAQAGRYAGGLDPTAPASGPTAPASSFGLAGSLASSLAGLDFTAQLLKWINQPDARTLRMRTENGMAGDVYSMTIELDALGGENALGFSLTFDAARWRVVSIAAGREAKTAHLIFNTNYSASGRVGIAMALRPGESLVAGTHQLVTIRFAPLFSGGAESPLIGFGDEPIAREVTDAEANPLPAGFVLNNDSPLVVVSAADFYLAVLSSGSLAAAFGRDLAAETLVADTQPLPTTLGGTQALVRDSQG